MCHTRLNPDQVELLESESDKTSIFFYRKQFSCFFGHDNSRIGCKMENVLVVKRCEKNLEKGIQRRTYGRIDPVIYHCWKGLIKTT